MNAHQKQAAKELASMAFQVGRICTKLSRGFRDDGDDLRALITAQEKAHRRGAPAGHHHSLPVRVAVDYFMVRIFADAYAAPDATASELDGMRDDYVRARLIMTRKASDGRSARDLFGELQGLQELSEKYDYPELVRS